MVQMITTLIGLVAGAVGYLIITFWFRPILRYKEIRSRVISDIVFFANAVSIKGADNAHQERVWQRVEANRRHSADLAAIYGELPHLYIHYLKRKGISLDRAVSELMGLSNTFDWKEANERVKKIHDYLKIKPRVV